MSLAVAVGLVAVVVLGVVAVVVIGLPVVVATGVALLALVAGIGSRVTGRSRRGRERGRGRPRSFPRRGHASTAQPHRTVRQTRGQHPGGQDPAGQDWTMHWDSRPPADAVPLARGRLSAALDDWNVTGGTRDDVLLVATELLSNAVEHADGPVRLSAGPRDGAVRVEVRDGAVAPPRPSPSHSSNGRGRGLHVVDGLSSNWGWTALPTGDGAGGKVVWADVPDGPPTRSEADHPDAR